MARRTASKVESENRRRAHQLLVRVDDTERDAFRAAAEASGLDLSTWARIVLRRASGMMAP